MAEVTLQNVVKSYGQVRAVEGFDLSVGDGEFLMVSLPAAVSYDGTDNELDPTEGFRVGVKGEPFYEAERDNFGLISEVEGSTYFGFADDRVVLAGRLADLFRHGAGGVGVDDVDLHALPASEPCRSCRRRTYTAAATVMKMTRNERPVVSVPRA